MNIDAKPELAAIVSDGKVFFIDDFLFNIPSTALPPGTYRMIDVLERENKQVENVLFPAFYDSLEEQYAIDDDFLSQCKELARRHLLFTKPVKETFDLHPMFNTQDIADSLCGAIDLETEALKRLREKKEIWIRKKTFFNTVKRLMENNATARPEEKIVNDYELRIAKGLRNVDAKAVTAEFTLNGKSASEKMSSARLSWLLVEKSYFSSYDFMATCRGEKLIEKLGATDCLYGKTSKEVLTCKNISKITYGKKILYVREEPDT